MCRKHKLNWKLSSGSTHARDESCMPKKHQISTVRSPIAVIARNCLVCPESIDSSGVCPPLAKLRNPSMLAGFVREPFFYGILYLGI